MNTPRHHGVNPGEGWDEDELERAVHDFLHYVWIVLTARAHARQAEDIEDSETSAEEV